jgi:uncharacterized protein YjiS (DUF1127 family)
MAFCENTIAERLIRPPVDRSAGSAVRLDYPGNGSSSDLTSATPPDPCGRRTITGVVRNPIEGRWSAAPERRNAMRMIDRRLEIDILATRRPAPSLFERARYLSARFVRAWQNRRVINRLNELDDHRLLDMGLSRSDVHDVRMSSFFSDAGLHLTLAARERARRHLRSGRTD